jgi:flagellar protein FlaG
MKIQGIVNAAVEPKTAAAGYIMLKAVDPPKEKTETAPPAVPSAPTPPDHSKVLDRLAEAIRKYIRENRTSVDITVDAELQQIVSRVIDEDSGQVIRQYPEDAVLAVMKHLKELRGLLIDGKG